jgi:hypothetical protein
MQFQKLLLPQQMLSQAPRSVELSSTTESSKRSNITATASFIESDTSGIGEFANETYGFGQTHIPDEDFQPDTLLIDLAPGGTEDPQPVRDAPSTPIEEQSEDDIVSQTMQGLVTHATTQLQLMTSRLQARNETRVLDDIIRAPAVRASPAARSATGSQAELQNGLHTPQGSGFEAAIQRYAQTTINIALDAARTDLALESDTVGGGLRVLRIDPGARHETSCPDCRSVSPMESELRYDSTHWTSLAANLC